jgi:hypothetical protein
MEQLQLTARPIIEILLDASLCQALVDALAAEHGRHLPIHHQYHRLALHGEATAEQLRQVLHTLIERDYSVGHTLIGPLIFHPNMPDDLLLELCEHERFITPLAHRRGPHWLLEKLAKEHRISEAITSLALYYYATDNYSDDEFKAFIYQYQDDFMLRWNLKPPRHFSKAKHQIALSLLEQYDQS